MKAIGVIPARMAATRFPNKPLASIAGIPMIGHVYLRSRFARELSAVYVATCDEQIRGYCQTIPAPCVMTSDRHQRASDRTAEAVEHIEAESGPVHIVMMIQGDEPLLDPQLLDLCVSELRARPEAVVVNLVERIQTEEDFNSANVVKTVLRPDGSIIYFSREPIPSRRKASGPLPRLKQLGLIAFRRDFLRVYAALDPTPLEQIESVDMLRVIEHGYRIQAVETSSQSVGVDTPADLLRAESLLQRDALLPRYRSAVLERSSK